MDHETSIAAFLAVTITMLAVLASMALQLGRQSRDKADEVLTGAWKKAGNAYEVIRSNEGETLQLEALSAALYLQVNRDGYFEDDSYTKLTYTDAHGVIRTVDLLQPIGTLHDVGETVYVQVTKEGQHEIVIVHSADCSYVNGSNTCDCH